VGKRDRQKFLNQVSSPFNFFFKFCCLGCFFYNFNFLGREGVEFILAFKVIYWRTTTIIQYSYQHTSSKVRLDKSKYFILACCNNLSYNCPLYHITDFFSELKNFLKLGDRIRSLPKFTVSAISVYISFRFKVTSLLFSLIILCNLSLEPIPL